MTFTSNIRETLIEIEGDYLELFAQWEAVCSLYHTNPHNAEKYDLGTVRCSWSFSSQQLLYSLVEEQHNIESPLVAAPMWVKKAVVKGGLGRKILGHYFTTSDEARHDILQYFNARNPDETREEFGETLWNKIAAYKT